MNHSSINILCKLIQSKIVNYFEEITNFQSIIVQSRIGLLQVKVLNVSHLELYNNVWRENCVVKF